MSIDRPRTESAATRTGTREGQQRPPALRADRFAPQSGGVPCRRQPLRLGWRAHARHRKPQCDGLENGLARRPLRIKKRRLRAHARHGMHQMAVHHQMYCADSKHRTNEWRKDYCYSGRGRTPIFGIFATGAIGLGSGRHTGAPPAAHSAVQPLARLRRGGRRAALQI